MYKLINNALTLLYKLSLCIIMDDWCLWSGSDISGIRDEGFYCSIFDQRHDVSSCKHQPFITLSCTGTTLIGTTSRGTTLTCTTFLFQCRVKDDYFLSYLVSIAVIIFLQLSCADWLDIQTISFLMCQHKQWHISITH